MDKRGPKGFLFLAGAGVIIAAIGLGMAYLTGEVIIIYALLSVVFCLFLCLGL